MTLRNTTRSNPLFISGIGLALSLSACNAGAGGALATERLTTDGGLSANNLGMGGTDVGTGGSSAGGGATASGGSETGGTTVASGGSGGGVSSGGRTSAGAGGTTASAGGTTASTGGTTASTGGTTASAGGTASTGGTTAGTGGTTGTGGGSVTLVNPPPGSKLFLGANFWNIGWEPSSDFFVPGTDFKTTSNPWQPQLLQDLKPFHVIRYMDWNLTNFANNPNANWSTRKQPTDSQDNSVAFEWQIDLCNRTKTDYWVNIPHEAGPDMWQKLAQLIHDKLDPSLRVYVEWSNEVWNGGFPQASYSAAKGSQLGLGGAFPAWSYQAYESVRVWETFEGVFGKNSPRVVKVIAGQMANSGVCSALMTALNDPKINPNHTKPTAYAGAPYFSGTSISGLQSGIQSTVNWTENSISCASGESLPVISYEGGQDSFAAGVSGCSSLAHDPAMRGLYKTFLDAQSSAGLKGPFMQYTQVGSCWGLKEKTSDSTESSPKYQGVLDWLATQ